MNTHDENQLIETCLLGSRNDFEPLVKKYRSPVIALAINILGNYDDALDIAQETFVQAFTNLRRFDTQRNFKSWILGIAAKRCLDHLKKQKSFLNYFLKHPKQFHLNANISTDHKTIEESEIFSPLLKKMKNKERVAILLKINENYSAKEIADVLDCSESTARVHLFNAKQKLKKELLIVEKNKTIAPMGEVLT